MSFPFNAPLRIRKAPAAPHRAARARGTPLGPHDSPAQQTQTSGDDALNRLVKLAPSEIMTVYLAGKAAFVNSLPMLGLVVLIVCFVWRWLTTREEGKPLQWLAILSSSISFGLWV